jgi:hypothetical protein
MADPYDSMSSAWKQTAVVAEAVPPMGCRLRVFALDREVEVVGDVLTTSSRAPFGRWTTESGDLAG